MAVEGNYVQLKTQPNILKVTIDQFARSIGFQRKASRWYKRHDESITVLDLQKSQYGQMHFLNIGVWLLAFGDATAPSEIMCHVRTRIEGISPSNWRSWRQALDLESEMREEDREALLDSLLRHDLEPRLDLLSSLNGVRRLIAEEFPNDFMVDPLARDFLVNAY